MTQSASVKVSRRYQISLPSVARKELKIQAGDRLLVDVQDGMIVLLPQPENYVEHLSGLHREVWQDIDTKDYLNQERDAWHPSSKNWHSIK